MIVIESSALFTIIVATISTAAGVIATWHFAGRHFSKQEEPITAQRIELEKVKNKFRSDALALSLIVALPAVLILGSLLADLVG